MLDLCPVQVPVPVVSERVVPVPVPVVIEKQVPVPVPVVTEKLVSAGPILQMQFYEYRSINIIYKYHFINR